MSVAPVYRADDDAPLQQGDLVLAPLGRLASPGAPTPSRWAALEQERHVFPFEAEPELGPLESLAGYAPAMVVTHDCQMDKEFLERYRELRAGGAPKRSAIAKAEEDPDLDRFIVVAPVIPATAFRAATKAITEQRVIGLFGIPALPAADLPASAVDLGYRATIDRHSIVARLAVLTEEARTALRYALARCDALRTPSIGFEIESAIGKRIRAVRAVASNPLLVELDLADGSTLTLVQRPEPVDQEGPRRTAAPRG